MSNEKLEAGLTSHLTQELDKRLYYVEPVILKHKKTGKIKLCRVFSWRDDDGRLHHDYFSHNQQPARIAKTLVSGGYNVPITEKGRIIKLSELKKAMFSCAVGLVV